MSKGLVLLHSMGIGRKVCGGGCPYWTLFVFLWGPEMFSLSDWCISHAKEDCVSPPTREQDIRRVLCRTTKCPDTNIVHTLRGCKYDYLCCWCTLFWYDIWSLISSWILARESSGGSMSWNQRKNWGRKWIFFSTFRSPIRGFGRFMIPWNLEAPRL